MNNRGNRDGRDNSESIRLEEERRRRKEKNKKRRKRTNFIEKMIIIIAIGTVIYMSYRVYNEMQLKRTVEIFAELGSLEQSISGKAKIIRNEQVITATSDGDVEYYYHEGDKVKNGIRICKIYKKSVSKDFEERLDKLDKSITRMQTKNLSDSLKQEIESVDDYIYSLIDEYLVYSNTDYEFNVNELKEELKSKFEIKRNIFNRNDVPYSNSNIDERDKISNVMQNNNKYIYAPMGGIISYYVDGFEENYKPENIANLKGKYLQVESSKMITGNKRNEVKSGETICKIVDNSFWYITAILKKDDTKDWTINDEKILKVKNVGDTQIKGTIYNILEYNNTNIITFKISEQLNRFMAFRDIEIEVIEKEVAGIKVPISSLAVKKAIGIPKEYVISKQNKKYVIKLDENLSKKTVTVEPVSEDDLYYYVFDGGSTIKKQDIVVNSETDMQVRVTMEKDIEGVYQILGTIMRFEPVNILIRNEAYTILDNGENVSIKLYDKIILDSETVEIDESNRIKEK